MRAPWMHLLLFCLFLILYCYSATAQTPVDYPTANLSTTWTNTESFHHSVLLLDGSRVRAILFRGSLGPGFACGFYCNDTCTSYFFSVFYVQSNSSTSGTVEPGFWYPQVVWSANRDQLAMDVDGSIVWNTNTAGKSVAGMNLTDDGNLVLFDANRSVVWQSFDYPTDCLVLGQRLFQGQQLIPSVHQLIGRPKKVCFLFK
ncbi:putative non-specific serine/threonine protein kinase [Helianthus debilis subsp. tardiflorus]